MLSKNRKRNNVFPILGAGISTLLAAGTIVLAAVVILKPAMLLGSFASILSIGSSKPLFVTIALLSLVALLFIAIAGLLVDKICTNRQMELKEQELGVAEAVTAEVCYDNFINNIAHAKISLENEQGEDKYICLELSENRPLSKFKNGVQNCEFQL